MEAVAGAGKTTTIVRGLDHMTGTVCLVAFNSKMAKELKERVAGRPGVEAKTFHSAGFSALRKAFPQLKNVDPTTRRSSASARRSSTRSSAATSRASSRQSPRSSAWPSSAASALSAPSRRARVARDGRALRPRRQPARGPGAHGPAAHQDGPDLPEALQRGPHPDRLRRHDLPAAAAQPPPVAVRLGPGRRGPGHQPDPPRHRQARCSGRAAASSRWATRTRPSTASPAPTTTASTRSPRSSGASACR
jgi:hypothetical protein